MPFIIIKPVSSLRSYIRLDPNFHKKNSLVAEKLSSEVGDNRLQIFNRDLLKIYFVKSL